MTMIKVPVEHNLIKQREACGLWISILDLMLMNQLFMRLAIRSYYNIAGRFFSLGKQLLIQWHSSIGLEFMGTTAK